MPFSHDRCPVSEVADAGEQEIAARIEQVERHQLPEEVAPRHGAADRACNDPRKRSEDQIGECASCRHETTVEAAFKVNCGKNSWVAPNGHTHSAVTDTFVDETDR